MRIGDIARALGTTPRTLRFYEEQGLVVPRRTAGGTRIYDEGDRRRFEAILRLARLHVPLADIRALIEARPASTTGDEASHRVSAHLDGLRRELTESRRLLERLEAEVEAADDLVRQCFGCKRPPTARDCVGCPVAGGVADIDLLQLIWDREETT